MWWCCRFCDKSPVHTEQPVACSNNISPASARRRTTGVIPQPSHTSCSTQRVRRPAVVWRVGSSESTGRGSGLVFQHRPQVQHWVACRCRSCTARTARAANHSQVTGFVVAEHLLVTVWLCGSILICFGQTDRVAQPGITLVYVVLPRIKSDWHQVA